MEIVELTKRRTGSYEGDLAVAGMKFKLCVQARVLSIPNVYVVGICAPSESWHWHQFKARTLKQAVQQSTWGPVVADALLDRADEAVAERNRLDREAAGLRAAALHLKGPRTGDWEEP